MNRTRSTTLVLAALAAASGGTAVAAAQSALATTGHAASSAALQVASVKVAVGSTDKAHSVLVSAKGLPVYLLTGDSSKDAKCSSGTCLTYWPAVTTTSMHPTVGAGVKGKVGVWHHNKINQVTLNGHPLYTFVQDHKGAALGEGMKSFGGTWEVLTPAGTPMAKVNTNGSPGGGSSGW